MVTLCKSNAAWLLFAESLGLYCPYHPGDWTGRKFCSLMDDSALRISNPLVRNTYLLLPQALTIAAIYIQDVTSSSAAKS